MAKKKEATDTSPSTSGKSFTTVLMEQFNKEFPDSKLDLLDDSDLADIPGWISTGNFALNWIISKSIFKGLPMGRITVLSGAAGSGKSLICLSMMKEPSIDTIVYLDTEGGGISKNFAKFVGVDSNKILYAQVDTVEDLIKRMQSIIDIIEKNKQSKNVLMIVDSISMVSTEKELNPEAGADMGNRAKVTRSFFRQYARKMQKLNIAAVFPAHLTKNIGGYGPDEVVAGGTILQYAPSIEIRFAVDNQNSEVEKNARGATMQKIRATVIKSRFGTKSKQVKFDLDNIKGINPYSGLFDILRDYQFIIPATANVEDQIKNKSIPKKSTGWYMFKPWEGSGKGDDEKTSPLTVDYYKKYIEQGLTSKDGKFREGDIIKYCKEHDWFLIDVQQILDTIDDEIVEARDSSENDTSDNILIQDVSETVDEDQVEENQESSEDSE